MAWKSLLTKSRADNLTKKPIYIFISCKTNDYKKCGSFLTDKIDIAPYYAQQE